MSSLIPIFLFFCLFLFTVSPSLSSSSLGSIGDVIDWASDRADKTLLSRCYDGYGCFSIGGKFVSVHRPINLFPFSPDDLQVRFILFTRSHPLRPVVIKSSEQSILNSTFRIGSPVKFIVHGFIEEGEMRWIKRMALQILRRGDFNVISVDWSIGATPPYTQAAANTRVVGAVIAEFIQMLQASFLMPPEMMHIIGHSLGAHTAGYAGERLKKLGRITGLDPAQPYFENTHPIVRLDPTDAIFVDVIHTDVTPIIQGGFGYQQPCGHIDFYPNGGLKQPGCQDNIINSIGQENGDIYGGFRNYIGCSHIRAYEYFSESINPRCPFLAVQCSSAESFEEGNCFDCGYQGDRCSPFGYHSMMWRNFSSTFRHSVKMYLLTGAEKPFCRYHQRITIILSDNLDRSDQVGRLIVTLIGFDGTNQRFTLDKQERTYQPATTYMFVVATKDAGPIKKVDLEWKPSSSVMRQLTWRVLGGGRSELEIAMVEVEGLESGYKSYFCIDDIVNRDNSRSAFANMPCGDSESLNSINKKHSTVDFSSDSSRSASKAQPSDSYQSSASSLFNIFIEKVLDIVS